MSVFEKIIVVGTYCPVLEKIRLKIAEALNKDFSFKENKLMKQIVNYKNEIDFLKENIKDSENNRKSLEKKLKKLSTENIDFFNENAKLQEENGFWKDYKRNIKLVDRVLDSVPLVKELRTKNSMVDGLDRKHKEFVVKEKKLKKIVKILKEKGINLYKIIGKPNDNKSFKDSMNLSRLDINLNDSF